MGGGGEGGFATRTPELMLSAAIRGGVTTLVGCLGTDGISRTMGNLTLNEEYSRLHRAFGWSAKDFLRCNQNALAAAFIPDQVRARLSRRLEQT